MKSILYLDQNFVSNLGKVENDPSWKDPHRDYYSKLLNLIRTKVNQNRLACPTSYFHREESEQSTRVKGYVWHLVESLGYGLAFRSSEEIHYDQLASAAYSYSGRQGPSLPGWRSAFNQDPQQPVDPTAAQGQILVHLESPGELIDYYRDTTGLVADVYRNFKLTRQGQSSSFESEVIYLKYQLLYETFIQAEALIRAYPELDNDLSAIGSISQSQSQARLLRIFNDCGVSNEFSRSQELLECPFLHCRASLMAADICFYPDMVATPSLNTDFDIVASVLPYVDILATDNHMAELISQAKLSERFSAKVCSMNRRVELLELVGSL